MYIKYSPLQSKQLLQQKYIDTQDTYLLVCLPEHMRCVQLKESLQQQLHQSFDIISLEQLTERLTEDVSGAVVFKEDCQCLSTALMSMAAELAAGADLVTANCAYGSGCGTECYFNGSLEPVGCPCVTISRSLLLQMKSIRKQSPVELILCAARLATTRCHISQSLFLVRRELQADDLYSANVKRALILTHEFSMTGAPIVLVNMVPALRSFGYEVVVLGPDEGKSLELFNHAGATVLTNADLLNNEALCGVALNCDLVEVNTVCQLDAIQQLNGAKVPVLWWLHDAFLIYAYIGSSIPVRLGPNVSVCAVGAHATAAMHSVRPDFKIQDLIYGLPDYAQDHFATYDLSFTKGKRLFVTVGSFEERKGQDILCDAIRLLPEEKLRQSAFLFVGKPYHEEFYHQVESLTSRYPDNVFYQESLTRDEIKSLMQQCSCVICASRDDPMPTFVTEGLIFGRPAIVSEHTGTAGLIQEGVDGFVYRQDSPAELEEKIEYFIDHPELNQQMSKACRALYERCFTYDSFQKTLKQLVQELTEREI